MADRVHDVSEYVTAPCGQALLECQGAAAASPSFDMLRCAGASRCRWCAAALAVAALAGCGVEAPLSSPHRSPITHLEVPSHSPLLLSAATPPP